MAVPVCEEKNEKSELALCEDPNSKDSKPRAFVTSVLSFFEKIGEKHENTNKGNIRFLKTQPFYNAVELEIPTYFQIFCQSQRLLFCIRQDKCA